MGLGLRPRGAPVSLCPGLGPQEIPSSPFRIKVDPSHDATKVKAEGPGLSRTGECPGAVGGGGGHGVGMMGSGMQVRPWVPEWLPMGSRGGGGDLHPPLGAVGQGLWVLWVLWVLQ